MFRLKIFVRVQTFWRTPFVHLRNSCHPAIQCYSVDCNESLYFAHICHACSSEICFDQLNHYLQLTIFQTPILLHYKEHCREPDSKVGKVYKIRFSKSNLDFSQPAVNKSKQTIVSNYPQKAIQKLQFKT